jgi:hypothetical protein
VVVSIPRDEPAPSAMPPIVLASVPADVALLEIERDGTSVVARITEDSPVAEAAIASPVTELAAARQQDAITMAMKPPSPLSQPQQWSAASPSETAKPDLPATPEQTPRVESAADAACRH